MELRKFVAPEFIFGANARLLVSRYVSNLGASKVLLVTDPGIIESGWVNDIEAQLASDDIPYVIFSEITPNPKAHEVKNGIQLFKEQDCDAIVTIGGGSPMDCAKGIGILASNPGDILDYEGVDEVISPLPPLICIPTTSGSAADVSQFAIITDTARKLKIAIVSKMVVPDVALIDPLTTTTMPPDLTAHTGMDALVHAIEAYVSNASSPITDLNALKAIELTRNNLLCAIENGQNLEARENMLLACTLAGLAFSNASLGAVHAMAHSLGGFLDFPHGEANALLLEHVINFNFDSCPERYTQIATSFGIDISNLASDKVKEALVSNISEFRKKAGVTDRLAQLGIKPSDLNELASKAINDACIVTNPKIPTQDDLVSIYEKAL
jgi:alcohol dehydrogenase class IV